MQTALVIRVPKDQRESLLALVEPEGPGAGVTIERSPTRRSGEVPWTELLLSLSSAASITAIGSVVKTWLDRTRGKIVLISDKTGRELVFEGQINHIPVQEITALLAEVNADDPAALKLEAGE